MTNTDLEAFHMPHQPNKTYYRYNCIKCGEKAKNTYVSPVGERLLENRLCYTCHYWQEFEQRLEKGHPKETIIDGRVYGPGNRTSGSFRGMAGRRFDIEYIEPSVHAGKRITTFDLWAGSELPGHLKEKFPDTARFLDGAKAANVGSINCWDPSAGKDEPYPLPRTLGIGND